MAVNLHDYINKRIEELTEFKSETFNSLKDMTKTVEELSFDEGKAILENKMKYYSASGALEELEKLKKILN